MPCLDEIGLLVLLKENVVIWLKYCRYGVKSIQAIIKNVVNVFSLISPLEKERLGVHVHYIKIFKIYNFYTSANDLMTRIAAAVAQSFKALVWHVKGWVFESQLRQT